MTTGYSLSSLVDKVLDLASKVFMKTGGTITGDTTITENLTCSKTVDTDITSSWSSRIKSSLGGYITEFVDGEGTWVKTKVNSSDVLLSAMGSSFTVHGQLTSSSTEVVSSDWNTYINTGSFTCYDSGSFPNACPSGNYGILQVMGYDPRFVTQVFYENTGINIYTRSRTDVGKTWSPWSSLHTSVNRGTRDAVLFSGFHTTGSIHLNETWANFDILHVTGSQDSGSDICTTVITKSALVLARDGGQLLQLALGKNLAWYALVDPNGLTLTDFNENMVIQEIRGVKYG